MWLNLFIVAIIITGFFAITLGLKLVFDKDAEIAGHSCGPVENNTDDNIACAHCQVKEIIKCDENVRVTG